MKRSQWFMVQGRRVRVYAVDPLFGLQSVNICTTTNRNGIYESTVYFKPKWHIGIAAGQFQCLTDLRKLLKRRQYLQEKTSF